MDTDSDEPLSYLDSMDYLSREIARLEKLVVEKTARVQQSVTLPAAAERRHLPGIPTAGIAGCRDPIVVGRSAWTVQS